MLNNYEYAINGFTRNYEKDMNDIFMWFMHEWHSRTQTIRGTFNPLFRNISWVFHENIVLFYCFISIYSILLLIDWHSNEIQLEIDAPSVENICRWKFSTTGQR